MISSGRIDTGQIVRAAKESTFVLEEHEYVRSVIKAYETFRSWQRLVGCLSNRKGMLCVVATLRNTSWEKADIVGLSTALPRDDGELILFLAAVFESVEKWTPKRHERMVCLDDNVSNGFSISAAAYRDHFARFVKAVGRDEEQPSMFRYAAMRQMLRQLFGIDAA